jgi:ferredoxin-NADP reductase
MVPGQKPRAPESLGLAAADRPPPGLFPDGRRMPPAKQTVRLVGSRDECDGMRVFTFTRPEGYRFEPGQYRTITLRTREGVVTKAFTHCDAPGDEHSMLLTRMTGSAFKDALGALEPGAEVETAGPFGRLTVPEGVSRVAFLVGGVGVTPAASIVRDSVLRATGLECLVFYGNRAASCIPLRADFDGYAASAPVRRVDVLSEPDASWTGERGYIDAALVRRHCDPLDGWHWFVSGPPAMADAMRAVLAALGVPAAAASFELFAGYR